MNTKNALSLITCGADNAGKSTLVNRIAHELNLSCEDCGSITAENGSRVSGRGPTAGIEPLAEPRLAAEWHARALDLPYRFFSTKNRNFVVADSSNEDQFTLQLITGPWIPDVAVIVVDARNGIVAQIRRHTYLASIAGVRHVVVGINKMDSVGYSQEIFTQLEREYRAFAARLSLTDVVCIPMSAAHGGNLRERAKTMPWYKGETLIDYLESDRSGEDVSVKPFRFFTEHVEISAPHVRSCAGVNGRLLTYRNRLEMTASKRFCTGRSQYGNTSRCSSSRQRARTPRRSAAKCCRCR